MAGRTPRRERAFGLVLGLVVTASLVTVPTVAAEATRTLNDPPPVPEMEPVPGAELAPVTLPPDPEAGVSLSVASVVSWPQPGVAEVDVSSSATSAGDLPVRIGQPEQAVGRQATSPERVRIEVLGRAASDRAGVSGLVLRLASAGDQDRTGPVRLTVDYSGFRSAYGGDWASRLRLVRLPDCALDTGSSCGGREVLASDNDASAGTVAADVPVDGDGGLFAVTAAPSSDTGDYTATKLSPSASWQVSAQTGDFSWSYPMRVPPVPGGLTPNLSLSYSSGSVDGRTSGTNNQPSWIGEGWAMWPGYIERSYRGCADDTDGAGNPETGDLCWAGQHVRLMLGGRATELVQDAANPNLWRAEADDGARIERLTGAANGARNGEFWKLTTTDGTQYVFGRNRLPNWTAGKPETNSTWTVPVFGNHANDPCHAATFATSWCMQAWRWNLDHVIDRHGNTVVYYYDAERNRYGRNLGEAGTLYTRGGTLVRVEYGLRIGHEYEFPASARVIFDRLERCVTNCVPSHPENWPDTPWDQRCTSGDCPNNVAPTFWTQKRLSAVTTQIRSGSGYRSVDRWTLKHEFPPRQDATTNPTLWLNAISHEGLVGGSASVPDVTFDGIALENRVDALEGISPLYKFRVETIRSETGGITAVSYSDPDCVRDVRMPSSEDHNTLRCFPVYWLPPGQGGEPIKDWFHKYVVTQVTQSYQFERQPGTLTAYHYMGAPAWRFTDNDITPEDKKTWSQWRGYSRVRVIKGDSAAPVRSATEYLYFRGMHGDHNADGSTKSVTVTDSQGGRVVDDNRLNGFVRETIRGNGLGGPVISATIADPWLSAPTATRGEDVARLLRTAATRGRVVVDGGWRRTETRSTFNSHGLVTQVDDRGDIATAADDLCTRTSYATNPGRWMFAYPSRVETVGVACGVTPSFPADAVSDVRNFYDGSTTLGALPGAGNPTRVDTAKSRPASGPVYVTTAETRYDGFGRVTSTTDVLGRTSTTAYTPALTGPLTQTVATNPAGHTTTTTLEPAWGVPVAEVDPNGRRTDLAYDPLGRLLKVWLPGRSKPGGWGPNMEFGYLVRNNAHTVVTTRTLDANGNLRPTYQLYDGLLRPRQTQTEAVGGGRIITDTVYDSRGLAWKTSAPYFATGDPGTALFTVNDDNVPSQEITVYDGAERPIARIHHELAVEKWRTTIRYGGNWTTVDPPEGGTATATFTDARGRTTALWQYHNGSPSGPVDVTRYAHTDTGQLATLTDPAGNVWTYSYDLLGRKTRTTDPDKGVTTYAYDDAGQLLTTPIRAAGPSPTPTTPSAVPPACSTGRLLARSWPSGRSTLCSRATRPHPPALSTVMPTPTRSPATTTRTDPPAPR